MNRLLAIFSFAVLFTACSTTTSATGAPWPTVGLLYTNVIEPYDIDMNNSPVGTKVGESTGTKVVEPFSGAGLSVEVADTGVADATEKNGMDTANLIDLKSKLIFFGLFQERKLIVSGE